MTSGSGMLQRSKLVMGLIVYCLPNYPCPGFHWRLCLTESGDGGRVRRRRDITGRLIIVGSKVGQRDRVAFPEVGERVIIGRLIRCQDGRCSRPVALLPHPRSSPADAADDGQNQGDSEHDGQEGGQDDDQRVGGSPGSGAAVSSQFLVGFAVAPVADALHVWPDVDALTVSQAEVSGFLRVV